MVQTFELINPVEYLGFNYYFWVIEFYISGGVQYARLVLDYTTVPENEGYVNLEAYGTILKNNSFSYSSLSDMLTHVSSVIEASGAILPSPLK
jgi:hypothetical protein